MKRRVVVTGIGCITPIGNNKEEFLKSLLAGKNGIDKITSFDASDSKSKLAAEVKKFNPRDHFSAKESKRIDRVVQFALVASREAYKDSKLNPSSIDSSRLGVIVGTGVGGINTYFEESKKYLEDGCNYVSPLCVPKFIPNMTSGHLAMEFGAKGIVNTMVTACAASTHAIGEAYRLIKDGYQDIMLAGGSEACINPVMQAGFLNMNAHSTSDDKDSASIPFDLNRDGFILGEGSAFMVLEAYESALERKAKIYGEIVGFGFTTDAYHMTSPEPNGEGIIRCMKQAIDEAGVKCSDIGYVNAHGTATVYNDRIESKAIESIFAEFATSIKVSSTKSMIGHLLGAAGAVEIIASLLCINEGMIHPTIGLKTKDPTCKLDYVLEKAEETSTSYFISNSFGFGGHNGSLLLKKVDEL